MGSKKNKDNKFFKDFKKSAIQGAVEEVPEIAGEKVSKEISEAYLKGEISLWAKSAAKEVPRSLFATARAAKIFGALQVAKDIDDDYNKTHNLTYAVTKNAISFGAGKLAGFGATAAIGAPTAGADAPLAIAGGIATDAAVSTAVNKGIEKLYNHRKDLSKKWIKYYNDLQKFKKLEPAKYNSSNKPIAGVANNTGFIDNTQVQVTYPQPVISENPLGWLGQLGSILSGAASIISTGFNLLGGTGEAATATTSAEIVEPIVTEEVFGEIVGLGAALLHTGGTVVPNHKGGRNEMIAILQGGETVRTEAQEKELQDAKMKEFLDAYAPLVSGENDENNPYAQVFGNNKSKKKDPKTPVLMNKTTHDEETIIAIIADAWKSNRSGFRNVLRYN